MFGQAAVLLVEEPQVFAQQEQQEVAWLGALAWRVAVLVEFVVDEQSLHAKAADNQQGQQGYVAQLGSTLVEVRQ